MNKDIFQSVNYSKSSHYSVLTTALLWVTYTTAHELRVIRKSYATFAKIDECTSSNICYRYA